MRFPPSPLGKSSSALGPDLPRLGHTTLLVLTPVQQRRKKKLVIVKTRSKKIHVTSRKLHGHASTYTLSLHTTQQVDTLVANCMFVLILC